MGKAKEIRVHPISSPAARAFVKHYHYSGKVTANSQLHLGVFLKDRLHGVMQFGPSIDKRKMQPLVRGTGWHQFLELNRLAFDDRLPKNSESRALAIAFRLIRREYPQIKWIVSFADACQCGDGTIYRAAGFLLTSIKKNKTMLQLPSGEIVADKTLNDDPVYNVRYWRKKGAMPLPGFQLRYIKFLDPAWESRLECEVLPYTAIEDAGASMYMGQRRLKQATGSTTVPATGQHRSNRSKEVAQHGEEDQKART